MSNMELWDKVSKTDPNNAKSVNDGRRNFTTIDAYSQIQKATEMWGTYGNEWGLIDIEYKPVENTSMMMVRAVFKYPTASFPITTAIKYASNKGTPDHDFPKKAETDLITKSLSRLGFNVDVFLGKFDDSKYVESLMKEAQEEERLVILNDAIDLHRDSIDAVKAGIEANDLASAVEAFYELTRDELTSIWAAPSKGGPFTTEERKIFKSDEWNAARKAHFGDDK